MNRPPWRDPIFLIPIAVMILAVGFLLFTWRQFTTPPPIPTPSPTGTPRPTDPEALTFLQNMEASMNKLSSLKAVQTLSDDNEHTVITTMLYTQPGSLYLKTSTGEESVVIGSQQWARDPKDPLWQPIQRVQPFVFPNFHDYSPQALEVQFDPETTLDGQPTRAVAFSFFTSTGTINFKVFGDPQTLRFQRVTMEAPGHHMLTNFVDYAPVVTVTPPPADSVAPTGTP